MPRPARRCRKLRCGGDRGRRRGGALARAFTLAGARVVVLEKAVDVLDGASKGNSAILHTGFDAPEGSVELACIREGYALYHEIRDRLGLPVIRPGAMVLAWSEEEEAGLPALMAQAVANGVTDVHPLTGRRRSALEPDFPHGARRVSRAGRTSDRPLVRRARLSSAGAGKRCRPDAAGRGADRPPAGGAWHLATTAGAVQAGLVINAAGLWGDEVDRRVTGESWFTIKPRKGQFVVYDKTAAALLGHILLPVPTKITKGIVVCRTAFGNLLVGPTAEEQDDREHATVDRPTLQALMRRGAEILPALAGHEVTAVYAGLRPATEEKEYRIRTDLAAGYICVGGIRSTGLSAALGIAAHVLRLADRSYPPLADPVWPKMPNISVDWAARLAKARPWRHRLPLRTRHQA